MGSIFKSYMRPVILHGGEVWCPNENIMVILQRIERSTVMAVCAAERWDTDNDVMALNEAMDRLGMSNSLC